MKPMRMGSAGMAGFAWLNARRIQPHRPSLRRHWFEAEHPRYPKKKSTVAWLVTLVRAGYGVGLVCAPGLLIGLTGEQPGRRACAVARMLGVRHLAQAGLTVAARRSNPGSSGSLACGAAVDLLHASSMVALGTVHGRVRRTTLSDAALETALAMAGAVAAGARPGGPAAEPGGAQTR